MFQVVPAIDVSAGRLARYTARGPRAVDAFEGDPVAAAVAALDAGAGLLHVVDLDLAFEGEPRNLHVVAAIAGLGARVQAAGGVRTEGEVRSFLDAGADRVVVGSAALNDPDEVRSVIAAEASRMLVGLDVEDGRIRSRGREPVDLELMETVGWLTAAGAPGFLVTSVARVGALGGVDADPVRRVARAGRTLLAAGGVTSIEDLRTLRAAGAAGAVVGRAALDGALDLAAAIEAMA